MEPTTPPAPFFRVGVMESLTGPAGTYVTVAVQAKQIAVDEINASGGINRRMIELVVEDSKCNSPALSPHARRGRPLPGGASNRPPGDSIGPRSGHRDSSSAELAFARLRLWPCVDPHLRT